MGGGLSERFRRDGFVALAEPQATAGELAEVCQLLDGLFGQFARLGPHWAVDLGDAAHHRGPPEIPEVRRPAALAPALRRTELFHRCAALASALLGRPARFDFDHAIFKPPGSRRPIAWHQDSAYVPGARPRNRAHLWVALQDTPEDAGCMWFVPGSHREGLLAHRPLTPAAYALATDAAAGVLGVPCPLPAGGVTAHAPDTLHGSGPNTTASVRRAWVLQFTTDPPVRLRTRLAERARIAEVRRRLDCAGPRARISPRPWRLG